MKRLALLLAVAVFASAAHAKHVGKTVRPIAVVLNGMRLPVNPPPRFYQNHLLVPVRRIIEALGLQFEKHGADVTTYVGAKQITLRVGSTRSLVDGSPVYLDAAPIEIRNTLFAPLRFFTAALDAQAAFDRQTNSVEITSTLVGRSGSVTLPESGGNEARGTVTAVDLDSAPPTVTLTYNSSVRTMTVSPSAQVTVQDVSTGTSNAGELSDIHPGDWAQMALDRAGHVKRIVDAYGSRSGVVAAGAAGEIVLSDGHVITPSAATTITLNGHATMIDRLQVGDAVTVRYNIDTSEPRQIVATRKVSAAQGVAPAISAIDISPQRPLRKGDVLYVTMRALPGGLAGYDIGPYVTNLPMSETSSGMYSGSYKVPDGVNFADAPIFGRLDLRGTQSRAESTAVVSISTEPPNVVDFAPNNGATINNSRPSIYATFAAGTVPVNPSTVKLEVNGHDVTGSSTRTIRFVDYMPEVEYHDGPINVIVRVADQAGNTTVKRWTFYIKSRR